MAFGLQTLLKNTAQNLLIRDFDCPLRLDPKEDVWLQPPMMETDSGVDGGNYCMVYNAIKLTSAINIEISFFKLIIILLPDNLLIFAFCCKYEVAGSPNITIALSFL